MPAASSADTQHAQAYGEMVVVGGCNPLLTAYHKVTVRREKAILVTFSNIQQERKTWNTKITSRCTRFTST
jgi:hypothetical protein